MPFLSASGHPSDKHCGVSQSILLPVIERIQFRIPRDFPQMSVRILKRSGVTTPKCFVRRIGDRGSGAVGLTDDRIDFRFAANVVSEREFGCAARTQRNLASWARSLRAQ